jgi:YidC/Oxa1 family membrane protein insertase
MWDLIFNPLVTLMVGLYSLLGNNIIAAIIALTILIRFVTYPLTIQQMRSAKRTQELQPQLKKIQEKFKDDREKLSQAQMALYRENGVNPLGGCLPLLIQYPVLIAMYQAIYYALAATPYQLVDLSQRLLIPDLARLIPLEKMWLGLDLTKAPTPPGNPVFALVLPALVMVTTWLQFKVSMPQNTSTDPNDTTANVTRSMGTIMPVMFGFLALSFSVGLSVYFITSNVVGILQYSPQFKGFVDRIYPEKPRTVKTGSVETVLATTSSGSTISSARNKASKPTTNSNNKQPKSAGKSYGKKK